MKVLFTIKMREEQFKKIEELGLDVEFISEENIQNCEQTDDADILVAYNPFQDLDISKMKKLKYIILTSVGFDQLPKEKILNQNIKVSNNKGGFSIPIAEWVVMCILEIYKNAKQFYKKQDNKQWKMDFSLSEIYEKRIGFLGTGTIAMESAKRLKPFGVEIWGYNTTGRAVEYFDKCFGKDDIDEIFKGCDIVVSTMPCTKETEKMIDKSKFDLMKQDSAFINVGRGKLVNEEDLVSVLDKFKGVALDVFDIEPLEQDSLLWSAENVIVTPHNSWYSDKTNTRRFNLVYSNLQKYLKGEEVDNLVDMSRGY